LRVRQGRIRVVGGSLKGRGLRVLPGTAVRPTGNRVREALYDILGGRIPGAAVLDAYAGTGAIGIEALSRGASSVTFVENAPRTLDLLRGNLEDLGLGPQRASILPDDIARAVGSLQRHGSSFDVVFLDPPYGPELDRGLRLIAGSGLVNPDGVVVAEHEARDTVPAHGMVPGRTFRYGRVCLTLFMVAPGPQ